MAGYGHAASSTGSAVSGYDAKGSLNGYSAGFYGTWRQNAVEKDGAYVDGWLQYSRFKASVSGESLSDEQYRLNGYSASMESGYRQAVAESASGELAITPQLQAIWSGIKADDHREEGGTRLKAAITAHCKPALASSFPFAVEARQMLRGSLPMQRLTGFTTAGRQPSRLTV